MNDYYAHPGIRARMLEFLGGGLQGRPSSEYIAVGDATQGGWTRRLHTSAILEAWQTESDISRSLWDRDSLLCHLDLDYVNFDFPGEAYLNPVRVFELLEPVAKAAAAVLQRHNIQALHLLSGRGHHFAWRIARRSETFQNLVDYGRVNESLRRLYLKPQPPNDRPVSPAIAAAHAGLALVMEFLAGEIIRETDRRCNVPVEITALEVGPQQHGREMISVDISEYGDPICSRVIRVPFSYYLKPWQQREAVGEPNLSTLPPMFVVLLPLEGWRAGIELMRDMERVVEAARMCSTALPEQSEGMGRCLRTYCESPLRAFHDWFYEREPHGPGEWRSTYDQLHYDSLPLCVRHPLEWPNNALLRPANIRRLVRVLLAVGWHPRHIAGLLWSRYARGSYWGTVWTGYEPRTRAEFFVRLFAGQFLTGADDLVDLNCLSTKEEKLCAGEFCGANLADYRDSLIERRKHERLASRPFNRLFLPAEHL